VELFVRCTVNKLLLLTLRTHNVISNGDCMTTVQSGKFVRFGASRSRVQLSPRSYQDLVNWYCSLLTRRTVCRKAAGNTPRTQKQTELNETRHCTKLSRGATRQMQL